MTARTLFWLVPLLPLIGAGINGLLGAKLPRTVVAAIALACTAASFVVVCMGFAQYHAATAASPLTIPGPVWIGVSGFHADFNLYIDHLTLLMLMVVTGVGFLIHIYSAGYMAHEDGYWRFFSLSEPVHVLHAGPGAGREFPADVCRLGRRRSRLVPAHRLLLPPHPPPLPPARRPSSSTVSATSASCWRCSC